MVYGLVLVALALWLLIVGGARLATRFEYSSKAKRVLLAVGVASAGVAFAFTRGNWPEFGGLILYLATVGFTLPIFILLANLVAESWRFARQREYDSAIARLRQSEEACLAELRRLKGITGSSGVKAADGPSAKGADGPAGSWGQWRDLERELRQSIEQWEAAGGSARIRAMKVQEWDEELSGLTSDDLEERRKELEAQFQTTDNPDRAGQLQAQVNLVKLRMIRGAGQGRGPGAGWRTETAGTGPALGGAVLSGSLAGELAAKERELEGIRSSVRQWRQRKEGFLSGRIRLG
ncbi:MAG: hypothetical protein M1598_08880 [Actinobacteria bacterium]|nr:hypothetical protein [Actinomycetota bacterium]